MARVRVMATKTLEVLKIDIISKVRITHENIQKTQTTIIGVNYNVRVGFFSAITLKHACNNPDLCVVTSSGAPMAI